jgi:hypothetical protein
MRAAFPVALASIIVACSGAGSYTLTGPRADGGGSGSSSGGSSSGSSGGSSSGSGGGSSTSSGGGSSTSSGTASSSTSSGGVGDDESDAMPPPLDATSPSCTVSPPDGSACNSITPPPSTITVTCNATDPVPAAVGGVVRDGTYKMIASEFYADGTACPTPETDGVVWDICGTSWQVSQNDSVNGTAQTPLIANLTVATVGTNITITITCGIPGDTMPITYGYDADTSSLRLHIGGGTSATSGRVDTFARQ